MNILITAPSLNGRENISGISTLVRTIIQGSKGPDRYFHFRIGSRDGEKKRLKWLIEQVTLLPRIAKAIKSHEINAIHLNTDFTRASVVRDYVILSFIKFATGKPVLLHVHGGYMLMNPPKKRTLFWRLISGMLRKANVNVVLSDVEHRQLLENFKVKCEILPNAVESGSGNNIRKDFHGKIKFIFLGRIVEGKGVYLIIEALKQLIDFHDEFRFVLYGTGRALPSLLRKLQAIRTLDFEYMGVAVDMEKWIALQDANIFLLPSLYGEGLPVAMLEAMQSGCVPVVSDDASITTVVKNEYNGFVVKKGNLDHLAATLKKVLKKREVLYDISDAARKTVSEKFGISQYMSRLNSFYSTFLSN